MYGAADDSFEVLCRDDDFQEMVCEGLDAIDFFFCLTTPHKVLLVRPNRLTKTCCLSLIATVF
jgi:hypothetical protein